MLSYIPELAIMPPSKMGWKLDETCDELRIYLYGRVSVNLLYLDAMRLESFQVLNQVYKANVAVKGC